MEGLPPAQPFLLEAAEDLNCNGGQVPCPGKPPGAGEGAPFCVSSGHLSPPRDAKRLQRGFSSASVCPILLHSVTSMPWASSWESLLGTNGALF